jgi:hypothetical protein
VNDVRARPLLQFVERLAEVVQNLAVDEFDLSLRGLDRKEGGNPVDHLAKCEFVLHRPLQRRCFAPRWLVYVPPP